MADLSNPNQEIDKIDQCLCDLLTDLHKLVHDVEKLKFIYRGQKK